MKKTIIISAIALSISFVSVNAKTDNSIIKNYDVEAFFKVNSFCVSMGKSCSSAGKIRVSLFLKTFSLFSK